jgi:hypothetical protein
MSKQTNQGRGKKRKVLLIGLSWFYSSSCPFAQPQGAIHTSIQAYLRKV